MDRLLVQAIFHLCGVGFWTFLFWLAFKTKTNRKTIRAIALCVCVIGAILAALVSVSSFVVYFN